MSDIQQNYSLLHRNTFGIDARARYFVEYATVDELKGFLQTDIARQNRLLQIGGGSNLLFTADFDGVVLHSCIRFIQYHDCPDCPDAVTAHVGSGVVWDDFCHDAALNNLWGVENLSFIPGEVGASAVQNIGAYGVEACDSISAVYLLDIDTLQESIVECADCQYGYRHSRFKTEWAGRYIITAVDYRLHRTPRPRLDYAGLNTLKSDLDSLTPAAVRSFVTAIRQQKLPDPAVTGSAGSFFKNPVITSAQYQSLLAVYPGMPHYPAAPDMVKVPAAWLIDQCGFKGATIGGAQVYPKQPLVITNTGGASASDIMSLAANIQTQVAEKFGVTISPEVIYI